jgi:hypothetical protein
MVAAVLAGEVAGRWLVAHLSLLDHVPRRAAGGLDAWPAIVVAAKVAIALLLARLAWRAARALRVAAAGERILRLRRPAVRPMPTIGVSPRAWLASFSAMVALFVFPTSSSELAAGPGALFGPLLHTEALPVFAVLALVVAVLWRTVSRWLAALERYGELLCDVIRSARGSLLVSRRAHCADRAPRSRFGVAFECRPPPSALA